MKLLLSTFLALSFSAGYGQARSVTAKPVEAIPAPTSLCEPAETIIFSCPSGRDTISVCATGETTGSNSLAYRFGRKGKPVFSLAAPLVNGQNQVAATDIKLSSRTLMYSGGGGAYLRFDRSEYSYVVFTAIGRGWGEKRGAAVQKNGKTTAYHRCSAKPQTQIGPVLFDKLHIGEDAEEFLLPDR